MQAQETFEIYAKTRQDALVFLHEQGLVPDLLYISDGGWVEAVYDHPASDDSVLNAWDQLEAGPDVFAHKPILDVQDTTGQTRLRVHFNLYMRDERANTTNDDDKAGLWQWFKRLVS